MLKNCVQERLWKIRDFWGLLDTLREENWSFPPYFQKSQKMQFFWKSEKSRFGGAQSSGPIAPNQNRLSPFNSSGCQLLNGERRFWFGAIGPELWASQNRDFSTFLKTRTFDHFFEIFENMAEMTKFPYKNFFERGKMAISAIFWIFWGNPKNAQSSAAFGFFWDLIEDSWFLGTFAEKNFWHPKNVLKRSFGAILWRKWPIFLMKKFFGGIFGSIFSKSSKKSSFQICHWIGK